MASAYSIPAVKLPEAAPLRVVSPHPYSCRGIEPIGSITAPQTLHRSGLPVVAYALHWSEDPRGDCGRCLACLARWQELGVWTAIVVVED